MKEKLYKVVGISTHKGQRKVRYAQELTRIITLSKHGDTEIEMFELPYSMNKDDALSYAMENKLFTLENNKQQRMQAIIAKIKNQTSVEDVLQALN
jgi:hypothetical protein